MLDTILEMKAENVKVFAQNVYPEEGAYTGEITVPMLKSIGAAGAIVGHSERRELFGENDDLIAKKVKALYYDGLEVILCVGREVRRPRLRRHDCRCSTTGSSWSEPAVWDCGRANPDSPMSPSGP